jgi:hypothetical protein
MMRPHAVQLGEQAEDALARLSSAQVKLEAAEKRLESLGVDAVSLQVRAHMLASLLVASCPRSLQRFNALEVDKENELAAFGDRIKAATTSLQLLRHAAVDSLQDAQDRNDQVPAACSCPFSAAHSAGSCSGWRSGLSLLTSSRHQQAWRCSLPPLLRVRTPHPTPRCPLPRLRPFPWPPPQLLPLAPPSLPAATCLPCPCPPPAARQLLPSRLQCSPPLAITYGGRLEATAAWARLCCAHRFGVRV